MAILNEKTIGNKTLTPDGLGLGGKVISKKDYVRTVNDVIKKNKNVTPQVKSLLMELVQKSNKDSAILSPLVKSMSDKDVKIIAKDFGEVSGAWWFLNNYDTDIVSVEFPLRSNEPLVDYYAIRKNGIKVKVSAKAGKGAAPALNPIQKELSKLKISGPEVKVKKFIDTIVLNDGLNSILLASQLYNSRGWKELVKLVGQKNCTVEGIEKYLSTFKQPADLYKTLNLKYYSKIGRSAALDTITKILKDPRARRSGIILSPMAYSLVDEVNKNKLYNDFLSKACKILSVEQLYIDVKPSSNSLKYTLKGFKDNKFSFEYHSNAAAPGANKIGFKMDL